MSTVIEQSVQARMVASAPRMETLPATLMYDRGDPFAVRMAFPATATLEGTDVSWEFSRELLAAGVDGAAGVGDVRIRPFGYDRTVLEFHAAEGIAMVHVHTAELRRFLARAQELVPAGEEHRFLDLDRSLTELFGGTC
ncbi:MULTISPECIES: SsgA family sporulation/cell division regulator [unclassified Streptomyces]|uniref:SsgA family sporulation/cell division regulator n=1 Tax=unclassified Streptomyces TaxID=2593676 RepID=UPI0022553E0E|nr:MULTISPECIES: SsgA family sporulation/cell division regulator [unclassified Streptomyces]WSP58992.1 SsgA family sporulation/cell division regulator [Streptomyces sp. NBC_01241]WSU20489.1 SsgA family sporulation/cell division regulator [Streptomyces sp. NBC_01108]MCX4790724.1 SsgA family sporulation/cell division regulator [Streptomyces sp. NBC_01221]MCX4793546.1 SsgA family sporulation/cell division regulator [Streptomyces sp. NBC_01242]WSJ34975.1 SsgA family sporulation/cell division regul